MSDISPRKLKQTRFEQLVREFRFNLVSDTVIRMGNVQRAARALGIHRNAIYREFRLNGSRLTIRKLNIQRKLKFSATNSQHS